MSLEIASGIVKSLRRNQDFSWGEQRWEIGDFLPTPSLIVCAVPTQRSRWWWALDSAWRRTPNPFRWDPNLLPASSCPRHDCGLKHATKIWSICSSTTCVWGIDGTKLKEGKVSSRPCSDALSLVRMLCSGKRNCLLPLYGVVYLYVKRRQCLPSRSTKKLN